MEVVSFKCPNCGGELVFDPNTQNYSCPYCDSEFSQEQIDTMQKGKQPSQESEAADSAKGQEQEEAAVYVCPNCGAEIVTDPTTAATECYYCQSPVVLSERVYGIRNNMQKEYSKMICAVTRRYDRFISRWATDRSGGVMRWFLCG